MTQVEALAKYAARAEFGDLSGQSRAQLPIHILDSLGCCIAALGTGPIKACREQVAEFGGAGSCPLIGGGSASPLYAAFWHTALVRYLDFMDNFLAPTETCHTAGGGRASFARDGQERYAVRQPLLLGRVFQNGLIVRVRAYLDSAMVARLFEENPLA
jgi:MmgE/PrpD N-terminal domain